MNLSHILELDSVRFCSAASDKKRVLQTVSRTFCDNFGVPYDSILESLQKREALGTTGVGRGVALPHARIGFGDVDRVSGVFVRLSRGIDFSAIDRQPVDLVFALIAPPSRDAEFLKALALISRTLRDDATCVKLRANEDPATLYTILMAQNETSQAA